MTKTSAALATVALMVAVSAGPVAARGPGGPGVPGFPGGGPGPHGSGSSALLERLIYPCRSACFDAARTCTDTADAAALSCVGAACASTIDTARTACDGDPLTDDCRTARSALKTCPQACLTTRNDAAGTCRTTADDCLDACTE
jgi:hypothetical protein